MFLARAYGDGALGAPNATIQYPSLLDGIAFPPPWRVAGVHYAVGPDAAYSAAYLDPATISGTGITVNGTTKTITISAASAGNVTLTGYDFTDWNIYYTGTSTNRLTILHSKFLVGSKHNKPIFCDSTAGNLTIQYCDIDGNQDTAIGTIAVVTFPSGHGIFEYNRVRNATSDGVVFGAVLSFRGRYNLFDVMGFGASPHFDCFQLQNSPALHIEISFNTCYHTIAGTAFNSFARIASVSTGAISYVDIGFNVIIILGPGVSNAIQIRGGDVVGGLILGPNAHDNYILYTGADEASGPPIIIQADTSTITGDICVRNIDMATGETIVKNV